MREPGGSGSQGGGRLKPDDFRGCPTGPASREYTHGVVPGPRNGRIRRSLAGLNPEAGSAENPDDPGEAMTNASLIEYLPDPTLLLLGERTERANQAARELLVRHGLPPDLTAMLGPDVAPLIARARHEGSAEGLLPLQTRLGEPPVFRIAIRRMGASERFAAVLTDMSREFAWREQLASRNRELSLLNDIGVALSASLDLDSLAQRIHEQAGRMLNTTDFCLALYDETSGLLSFPLRVQDTVPLPALAPRPLGNGLIEYVLRSGQPKLLNGDVRVEAEALGFAVMGRPSTSWLGAPMLAESRAIGVISVQHFDGKLCYDEHDMEVLMLIAGQAAAAFRNARLLTQAHDAYRELSETQAARLEAERLRSITETVGGLNHEVNNPLAAIAGNAQLLLRDSAALADGVEDKVRRILEAARRIQSVTARMANLIHADSAPYPGEARILDVSRSLAREGYDAPAASANTPGDPQERPAA
jgi:GAF domain-containing protein